MQITTRQEDDVMVVDIVGRLDMESSGYAYDELVRIAESGNKKILLNVEKLEYVTSAGLRSILVGAKLLKSSQGEMKICQPNDEVKEVFEISGFNSLLHLYDTEKDALEAF